jgi:hypothetical protein
MICIPNIIIVGNKGVGKKKLIKKIKSGEKIHVNFPNLCDNSFIRINNKLYGKNKYRTIFENCVNEQKCAFILSDTKKDDSFEAIQIWYEKIAKLYPNISIKVLLHNKISQLNFQVIHKIVSFCFSKKIKLINI